MVMKKFENASVYFRWIARVVSGLTFLMFIIFAIGEGLPTFSTLSSNEIIMFVCLAVALIGILVAWKWSLIGSLLIIAGYVGFIIINKHSTMVSPFSLFPVIVAFYILACFFDRVLNLNE